MPGVTDRCDYGHRPLGFAVARPLLGPVCGALARLGRVVGDTSRDQIGQRQVDNRLVAIHHRPEPVGEFGL